MSEARLLLTCGLPAAGKTTLARQLAADRGALRLTQDEWLIALGSSPWDAPTREKVDHELWRLAQEVLRLGLSVVVDFGLWLRYRLGAATADAYHEAGFSVVVQDIVIGPSLPEYVAAIRSTPLIVVVLTPRPDVVAQREAARIKTAYRDGFDSIRELDAALRAETPRIGSWLDSSDQPPAETVEEIIERGLNEGRAA